ncbi:MAG TPA: hypothetical protein VHX44_00235 [Planctomycetota bacterium]|nr:hypothetical protein [Planctomycetota bacterium]
MANVLRLLVLVMLGCRAVVSAEDRQPWAHCARGPGSGAGNTIVGVTGDLADASDFANSGLRRRLIPACCWTLGLQERLPTSRDVTPICQPNSWKRAVPLQDVPR